MVMARLDGERLAAFGIEVEDKAPPPPADNVGINVPRVKRDRIESLLRTIGDYEEIARQLGVSRQEIEETDKEIKRNWNQRRMLERADRIDEELGHLEKIRALAFDHYFRTQQNSYESTRSTQIEPGPPLLTDVLAELTGTEASPNKVIKKVVRKTLKRDGELNALRLAMDVGKEIRSMMGIDAPEIKKLYMEGHVSTSTVDAGRLAHLGPSELAELHRAALEQSRTA